MIIIFSSCLLIGLVILILIPGRNLKGPWYYRSIYWFFKWSRYKGWNIPKWIDEKLIFQMWIVMFVGTWILGFLCVWSMGDSVQKFEKPLNGEGDVWEDVEIIWKDEKGENHREQFQLEIKEQQLNEEQVEHVFSKIQNQLPEIILGKNKSLDFVNEPLYLPEQIDEYSAEISWDSDLPWVLNWDGNLGDSISVEGEIVTLTATIFVQNYEEIFEIEVKVFPPEISWLDALKAEINGVESEELWLELPEEWEGISLTWKKDRNEMLLFGMVVVLFCPFLLFFKKKQEIEEKGKVERQQMLEDYPEIISKLMLLLSAGMNLRRAIEKIVSDYKLYYGKDGKRKGYELLSEICRELNCGVTEKQAYEKLGEKCELLQYRTLSALLVQHLQKGNRGMEQTLAEEVQRAQEIRQQQAKIIGEQASTKLLLPMLLMLIDVFIIIIIPAWISFSI